MAQTKYLYVVELDSVVSELPTFKEFSGFYDLGRIKSLGKAESDTKSKRFRDLKNLVEETQALSIRKLIRRLPDDVVTLRTRRGVEVSVEHFQRFFVLEIGSTVEEEKRIELLSKYKSIRNIEKDHVVPVEAWPPNDTYWASQTQFYSSTYNINLPRAWDFTAGNSGVKVAIIDHGVDYNHTDLGGGIGAGYRVRGGWDYKDNDSSPLPTYSTETHATPIAGMIGAINWNNTGVVGIAGGSSSAVGSGCQLFSFRVTSEDIAPNGLNAIQRALVAEAVFEAATVPEVNNGFGYGVDVINCSFGGISPNFWDWSSFTYHSYYGAFAWAYINSVVVTASRGNEGNTEIQYPANFSNGDALLSVSGVTNTGTFHSSSSYGDGVTIAAHWTLGYTTRNGNTYGSFSGTSNAAPMVAGVSALVLSEFNERGITVWAEDVREILKISAQPTNDPLRYGAGRLDAGKALYLSSSSFGLEHKTATKNRTVTTVPNPSGDKQSFYYPFGIFIVQQTKKITASIDVPTYYLLDSSWVWANANSGGLKWGNPSYGMYGASFVSKNGREHIYQMYVYELRDLAGNYLGWYPENPNIANIEVSVLGRYAPLAVSMSGPSTVYHADPKGTPPNCYTWTANVSGGVPPYSYVWSWPAYGTNSSYSECFSWDGYGGQEPSQFTFRVDVTDSQNSSTFATKTVTEYHSGGGPIPRIAENGEIIAVIPEVFGLGQNYPNPFNPETEITFALPEPSTVRLTVLDILGREVAVLEDGQIPAGYRSAHWNGRNGRNEPVSSGMYFYRLTAVGESGKNFVETRKMIITK